MTIEEQNTGVTDSAAENQEPEFDPMESPIEGETVPIAVLKAVREKAKALKGELDTAREREGVLGDQNLLLKSTLQNLHQGGGSAPAGQEGPDPMAGEDDEILTRGQLKNILGPLVDSVKGAIQEIRYGVQDAGEYKNLSQKHIPNVLKANPELIPVLKGLSASVRTALLPFIGKADPEYHKAKAKPGEGTTDKVVDFSARVAANLEKPRSPATVASSTGIGKGDKYRSMSPEELDAEINRVIKGG